ncbi:hypothetical protein ACHHYP_20853 [Achlya hypogyna]|uniref:RING-type domain-containing protein n=1 Tax=Achlya hypogyna TaxID=1202772 RepID=A0A1V9Y557_ACHHY|nr:hypothetical protein ACHHYP_20853 [Achlya hypogyna]
MLPTTLEAIDVHAMVAAKGTDVFAQYTVTITCPFTRETWTLQKRFSDFRRLRDAVVRLHRTNRAPCTAISLQELLAAPFPSKHLLPLRPRVMFERSLLFQNFLLKIVEVRNACWRGLSDAPPSANTAKQYVSLIADFLGIYDVPQLGYAHASPSIMNEACAICLDHFQAAELIDGHKVVQLPCSHIFHQRCVGQWLRTKKTCPLCRDPTTQITGLVL